MFHTENQKPIEFVLRQRLGRKRFKSQLLELINLCKKYGVSEVLLFPHGLLVDQSSSGFINDEDLKRDIEDLQIAKTAFNEAGLRMGINLWQTLGHSDRGRSMNEQFPFQPLVDSRGAEASSQPCPLCPQWQDYYMAV